MPCNQQLSNYLELEVPPRCLSQTHGEWKRSRQMLAMCCPVSGASAPMTAKICVKLLGGGYVWSKEAEAARKKQARGQLLSLKIAGQGPVKPAQTAERQVSDSQPGQHTHSMAHVPSGNRAIHAGPILTSQSSTCEQSSNRAADIWGYLTSVMKAGAMVAKFTDVNGVVY